VCGLVRPYDLSVCSSFYAVCTAATSKHTAWIQDIQVRHLGQHVYRSIDLGVGEGSATTQSDLAHDLYSRCACNASATVLFVLVVLVLVLLVH
jgi:hypothetical protein